MAFAENELFDENEGVGSGLRVWPKTIQAKTFLAGTGIVARLTPLVFDATGWRVWQDDDAVQGFAWPDPVTLEAGGEVIGQVLLSGIVHYDDIVLPAGQNSDNLAQALTTAARNRLFTFQGLTWQVAPPPPPPPPPPPE